MSATETIENGAAGGTDRRAGRREEKLARIVAEAWSLARRDGLDAISLRDLADRVGLRQPSLYAYFASKLDLYDVLFADGYRQFLAVLAAREPLPDPRDDLVDFVRAMVQFSTDDIVRHQMLFQRTIPGFEPSPASFALALRFYEDATARLAAVGVTEPADIDLFSALVSGMGHQQVANDPGGDRWVRLAARAVDMFLGADGAVVNAKSRPSPTRRPTAKRTAASSAARPAVNPKPSNKKHPTTKRAGTGRKDTP
jgi:AcrR family transcriptional regulator